MTNNLDLLRQDLKERAQRTGDNDFIETEELTDDERRQIEEAAKDDIVVIEERQGDSVATQIPIDEYAAPLDNRIKTMAVKVDGGEDLLKMINTGDVKRTLEDAHRELKDKAMSAFRSFAVDTTDIPDEDIVSINAEALEAARVYLKLDRITADDVSKRLGRLSLRQLTEILPSRFVNLYATMREIQAMDSRAANRLVATLAHVAAIGPDFDYLNDYIENEERLIAVSRRILECQISFREMLKSEEKLSEIAARAKDYNVTEGSIWDRYITTDPSKVHNEYAQIAVVFDEYVKAYTELLAEYPGDENVDARAMIQEQIDESVHKRDIYASVLKLDTFKRAWYSMEIWLKGDKRTDHERLHREGINSIERMRRSKQEVQFPVYDPKMSKRADLIYDLYMDQFPTMMKNYNSALYKVLGSETDEDAQQQLRAAEVQPITVNGYTEEKVFYYFGLLLLICYGRILKKLTASTATKWDAIELNAYFNCWGRLGTDIHLMNDVWTIAKPLVTYALQNWPEQSPKRPRK